MGFTMAVLRTAMGLLMLAVVTGASDTFLPVHGGMSDAQKPIVAAPIDLKEVKTGALSPVLLTPSSFDEDKVNPFMGTSVEAEVLASLFCMISLMICWLECCK